MRSNRLLTKKILAGSVLVGVGILGVVLLQASRAATPYVAAETETGRITAPATSLTDATASGGKAVRFMASTGTPPTTGSCIGAANAPGGNDPWGGCWPGPQNTGYPHGLAGDSRSPVKLTTYTGPQEIKSCGVVIENQIVPWLKIEVGNGSHTPDKPCVTIKNSWVKGTVFSDEASAGPVVISDTEVDSDGDLPYIENIGRYNYFTYRVNSHGGQGVIKCAAYCETKDNWIHGMTVGNQYHYNAIGGNGMEGGSWIISHNWASCGDWESVQPGIGGDAGCSAVIGFYGDFAPIQNITITRNFLKSTYDMSSSGIFRQAGYCLNPGYYTGKPYPNPTNMVITDNIFARGGSGKCGVYGPTNSLNKVGAGATNTWTNNKYEDGVVIGRPEE